MLWSKSGDDSRIYRIGAEDCHDLYIAPDTASEDEGQAAGGGADEPQQPEPGPVTTANAVVGLPVSRGPDWRGGDQDKGGVGYIDYIDEAGRVRVMWLDGSSNYYRTGDKQDLSACTVVTPVAMPGSHDPICIRYDGTCKMDKWSTVCLTHYPMRSGKWYYEVDVN